MEKEENFRKKVIIDDRMNKVLMTYRQCELGPIEGETYST